MAIRKKKEIDYKKEAENVLAFLERLEERLKRVPTEGFEGLPPREFFVNLQEKSQKLLGLYSFYHCGYRLQRERKES